MDKVIPRNNPESQSMTQDNVVKAPFMMPTPDNTAGNESGVSDTAGYWTTSGTSAPFAPPMNEINIDYSQENRSAKFKNGEGAPAWDAGAAEKDNGQYLGR